MTIRIIEKVFGDIKRNIAYLKDLKTHPLNQKLYPEEYQSNKPGLRKELKEHYDEHDYPNYEPIIICPETGIIWSGNSRFLELIKEGIPFAYVEYSKWKYNPNEPESKQLKKLKSFNSDNRRNTKDPLVAVHTFKEERKIYIKENGKDFTKTEIKNYWNERGIDSQTYNKWIAIFEFDVELLKEVRDGKKTLTTAYKQAVAGKPEHKANPERFDFFNFIDNSETFLKDALYQTVQGIKKYDPIIYDRKYGFEINQITGMVSNTFMSYFTKTFDQYDIDANTPKQTTGHPDIRFPMLDTEGFQSERIEIKAASWTANTKTTCILGGPGVKKNQPHEFIFVVWNADCKKLWAVITTLTRDDWKSGGKDNGNKYAISISDWYKQYHNTTKFRQIIGDTYFGNKDNVEIEFGDVDNVIDNYNKT